MGFLVFPKRFSSGILTECNSDTCFKFPSPINLKTYSGVHLVVPVQTSKGIPSEISLKNLEELNRNSFQWYPQKFVSIIPSENFSKNSSKNSYRISVGCFQEVAHSFFFRNPGDISKENPNISQMKYVIKSYEREIF